MYQLNQQFIFPLFYFVFIHVEACHYIAENSRAQIFFCEDKKQLTKLLQVCLLVMWDIMMCMCVAG